MKTLLFVILILLLAGSLPVYPYSHEWGYYPFAAVLAVILIVLILLRKI